VTVETRPGRGGGGSFLYPVMAPAVMP